MNPTDFETLVLEMFGRLNLKTLRRLACLMFLSFLLAMQGCGGDEDPQGEVSLPFSGQIIRLAVPADGDFRTAWDVMIREWEAQNDAVVEIVEIEWDSKTTEATNIAKAFQSQKPTLSFFPIEHVSAFAKQGLCGTIPEEELGEGRLAWNDFFPGLRDQILTTSGQPSVVAISSPTLCLYYRKDLLESAEISPPQTWQEYDRLTENLADWAPNLTVVEPWNSDSVATLFMARAFPSAKHPGNYSVMLDISTGEPLIDTEPFVRELERFLSHRKQLPDAVNQLSPAGCLKELIEGRAAMAIATSDRLPHLSIERVDNIQIGCVQLPGSDDIYNSSSQAWETLPDGEINYVPITAFDGFCATVTAESPAVAQLAAWNLIQRLTLPVPANGFEDGRRSLCRSSWYASAENWMSDELTGTEKLEVLDATSQSLSRAQLQAVSPFVLASEFTRDLTAGIQTATDDGVPVESALKMVADQWRVRMKGQQEDVKNSYRIRVGLKPTSGG